MDERSIYVSHRQRGILFLVAKFLNRNSQKGNNLAHAAHMHRKSSAEKKFNSTY